VAYSVSSEDSSLSDTQNVTMNNDGYSEAEILRASLVRQKQIIADKKKDVAFLEQKIRENLRKQDEIYLKLYPPVRPNCNAAYITTLIEDKSAELKRLQSAIYSQKTELDAICEKNFSRTTGLVSEASSGTVANSNANLVNLERNYAMAYANLEHLRSLLSPIRVLPLELLGEIFIHCCDAPSVISLSEAPLLVTHVCSSWRAIAIHKPEMWSSLKLGPDQFARKSHGLFHLAKLWLERSGNCPLRLCVRPMDVLRDGPARTDLFLDILKLYTPHYNRWKDVSFDYPHFDDFQALLFSGLPQDASFPLLERFGLYLGTMTFNERGKLSWLLHTAPRLQKVMWVIKAVGRDPIFPYDQLTSLEVGGDYSMKKVLKILHRAKALQIIDICIFIRSQTFEDLIPVVHESLTKLTFTCTGDSSVFFDSVTLPALREIHITRMGAWEETADSTWSQASFVSLLSRFKCKLSGFSIVDYDVTSEEILAILRYLSSSLVKFEVDHIRARFITDEVLNALTYPTTTPTLQAPENNEGEISSSILCPHIEELRIVGCISSKDGVLADMVESRCHPPEGCPDLAELGTALFGFNSRNSPQDKARIVALNRRTVDYMVLEEGDISGEWHQE